MTLCIFKYKVSPTKTLKSVRGTNLLMSSENNLRAEVGIQYREVERQINQACI